MSQACQRSASIQSDSNDVADVRPRTSTSHIDVDVSSEFAASPVITRPNTQLSSEKVLAKEAHLQALLCRSWQIAEAWVPVNMLFVGMISTSFFELEALSIPMITVLKNVTNLFTICGDYLLYGKVKAADCSHM